MQMKQIYQHFMLSMQGVRAKGTINWYKARLKPLISNYGELDIEQIDIHLLRQMRANLAGRELLYENASNRPMVEGQLSSATIRGHVRATRRLFNWATEEGFIEESPAQRLQMPPKETEPRRGIADKDREAMLDVVSDEPRDYAILMFIWETACRREGLVGLTFSKIDLKLQEAIVHEKGKSRTVYFEEGARDALQAYMKVHPGGRDVFVGRQGPLTARGIYDVFERAAEKAGVTELWSPHQWRHARARYWSKNGMPLKQVSQLLGHSDISVTASHYADFARPDLKAAYHKYS